MADLAKVAEFVLEFLVIQPLQLTKPLHSNRFAVMHALVYEYDHIYKSITLLRWITLLLLLLCKLMELMKCLYACIPCKHLQTRHCQLCGPLRSYSLFLQAFQVGNSYLQTTVMLDRIFFLRKEKVFMHVINIHKESV